MLNRCELDELEFEFEMNEIASRWSMLAQLSQAKLETLLSTFKELSRQIGLTRANINVCPCWPTSGLKHRASNWPEKQTFLGSVPLKLAKGSNGHFFNLQTLGLG